MNFVKFLRKPFYTEYGYSMNQHMAILSRTYNSLKSYIIHSQILENINQWIPVSCSFMKKLQKATTLRSSHRTCSTKKLFLTFSSNFIKKETLVQVFSCNFCKISKKTFSYRTPLVTASVSTRLEIFHQTFQMFPHEYQLSPQSS